MKIAFFDLKPGDEEYFRENLPDDELLFFSDKLNDNYIEKIKDIDILSVRERSKVKASITKHLENLKLIVTRTTGFDHIDADCYGANKVVLCNVPAYGQITVAEHAFALVLSLTRKIHKSKINHEGHFIHEQSIQGFDLYGKTIGIVGTGKIGSNVARIAKGFGMNILGFDFFLNNSLEKEYGLRYVSLNDLLAQSDIISLHLPLTDDTRYMINMKNINKVKKGCVLINTARGELVEPGALIEGLNQGIFSAAGLDVLEGEDRLFRQNFSREMTNADQINKKLLNNPNVIVTPHNAFNTVEAYQRILTTTLDNIIDYKNGNPINIIR